MGKKIVFVVISLALLVLVVSIVLQNLSKEGPENLLVRALDVEKSALAAFDRRDFDMARSLYTTALMVLEEMKERFPDSIEVGSEEYKKLKSRCRGRLASLTSPGATIGMMFELMKEDAGRLYLDYWDFEVMGKESMAKHWDGLTAKQRDRIFSLARDTINNTLKDQNESDIRAINVEVTQERIDGDRATVEVAFRVGNLLEIDLGFELSKQTGPWKVVDLSSPMSRNKNFTQYLADAFDEVLKNQSVEDFLNASDSIGQLSRAFDATAGDELSAVGESKKGKKLRVLQETQIMSGATVLGTVPKGEIFEIQQDQPYEGGKRWFLVMFVQPQTGKNEMGWISSEFVEILSIEEDE